MDDEEILSNCCSAPIIYTDMCSDCLEHCCGIDEEGNEVEL